MKKITQTKLNEIVFQGRNKAYGAFALRRDEGIYLTKALLLGVATFVGISVTPFVWSSFQEKEISTKKIGEEHILQSITLQEKTVEKKETIAKAETPKTIPVQQKTFDSTVPTPTKNPTQEKPIANVNEYKNAIASTQNNDGNATINYTPIITTPNSGMGEKPSVTTEKPRVENNAIVATVDKEAEFPGGINRFRENIAEYLESEELFADEGRLSTTISFVVEKDGSISNLKANGKDPQFNKTAIDAIKKIKKKWTPALYQGEKVRSYYSVPIVFAVE